jgi:hypothetical protein
METKLLGEYLLEFGRVDPEDIQEALALQAAHRSGNGEKPLIGDVLVDMGVVDHEDINTALAEQECARLGVFDRTLS